MRAKSLKIGMTVWLNKAHCCSGHHQQDEKCTVMQIDDLNCFECKTESGVSYWHELKCVRDVKARYKKPSDFLSDKDFEL